MKTLIFRTINSNEFDGLSAYAVFQFDNNTLDRIEERLALFDLLPEDDRPTYLVWLGESWVEWINRLELERFLDDLELDSETWTDRIDFCDTAVLVPGSIPHVMRRDHYRSVNDSELDQFSIDCEQVWLSFGPREIYFDCHFNDSNQILETRAYGVADLRCALTED